jgi:cell migration-inducing and hyaluronan-binding protein
VDSLFVGESENIGNPTTPAEKAYGRSLPKPDDPDFPIRGYEFYDYRHDVVNTTFVNYQPNTQRDAGAMSYLLFTSFGMSTENSVEGLKFVNSKPVDFPSVQRRWASDFGNRSAYRSATIHDKDGSVGGIPNSYIVIDNGIASDEASCEMKPSWGAAVCKGDMGRFNIAGDFDAFGARANTEPVMISRNGKRYEYNEEATVPSGAELRVETSRKTLSIGLREMDKDSFVILELPGFAAAAAGTPQDSLAALRAAKTTSYFKDANTLWVKLVVEDAAAKGPVLVRVGALRAQATIEVSKPTAVAAASPNELASAGK